MEQWIGEIVVGVVLLGFSFAFKNWSTTVREKADSILDKLTQLTAEFHQHVVSVEGRVTKIETEVQNLKENRANHHE